jgi:Na+/glutamate symporter
MNLTNWNNAHRPDSRSLNGSLHNERLHVRFRAWKRIFVIFGVITGILVVILIGLYITLGTSSSPSTFSSAPSSASSSSSTASSSGTDSSSQTAQTLAVAGLIVGCVSAIGTLLSGWGTFVTARAMARQDVVSHAPRARARSSKPHTRKV